jgi:hypothetical protein
MGVIATITKDEYKNGVFSEGIPSAIPHHKKAILLNPVLCEHSSAENCDQQCVTLRGKVPTASLLNSRCKIPQIFMDIRCPSNTFRNFLAVLYKKTRRLMFST